MLESLQDFVSGLPTLVQWLGVALIAAIPFVESYFGSAIGVLSGVHPVAAVAAAVVGNVASMLAFVLAADATRRRATRGREAAEPTERRQRLKRAFDRWGVAGVSLLGQTILPSQITSAALVGFGASRNAVIAWQIVSIILWGVLFGVLASLGVSVLR